MSINVSMYVVGIHRPHSSNVNEFIYEIYNLPCNKFNSDSYIILTREIYICELKCCK